MLAKLKTLLDTTWAWFIFLLLGVLYFWKKEEQLEVELAQEKANETIKDEQAKTTKDDSTANTAVSEFQELFRQYNAKLPDSPGGVQPGSGSAEDPSK